LIIYTTVVQKFWKKQGFRLYNQKILIKEFGLYDQRKEYFEEKNLGHAKNI